VTATCRWALWGTLVEGAGYSVQIMLGADDAEPWTPEPTIKAEAILREGPKLTLPLLGTWDKRPTIAEKNAVLPPGIDPDEQTEDEDEYGDVIDPDLEDGDW
jgi:hypothetical protein